MRGARRIGLVLALALGGCRDIEAERARRFERAAAAEATGDLDLAAQLLESAVDRDPRDALARRQLAEHWLRRGDAYAAREVLRGLPSDAARDAGYARALERVSIETAPLAMAARALRALEERVDDGAAREAFLGRWLAADAGTEILEPLPLALRREALRRLIASSDLVRASAVWHTLPAGRAETLRALDALLAASTHGEHWTVLEALEPALRAEPSPQASLALHRLLLRRGDWDEAEALEQRFLARHGGHPGRYGLVLARARRESRSGAPAAGLRLAREATRLRPDRAEGFVEQAIALRALDRGEKARRAVHSALLVDPSDPLALRLARELDPPEPRDQQHFTIELR